MTEAEEEAWVARGTERRSLILLCKVLLQSEVVDEVRGGRTLRAGGAGHGLDLESPPAPEMSR